MSEPVRVRHRRRLKKKEAEPVIAALRGTFGMGGPGDEVPLEAGELEHQPLYFLGADVVGFEEEGTLFPGLRALLKWPATKRWVTVDMGAIRFVTNGADVMAPGITDADPSIAAGDAVWIRDEKHGKPLAVGRATQTGPELKAGNKGKVVQNLHTIGDRLWLLGHEEN